MSTGVIGRLVRECRAVRQILSPADFRLFIAHGLKNAPNVIRSRRPLGPITPMSTLLNSGCSLGHDGEGPLTLCSSHLLILTLIWATIISFLSGLLTIAQASTFPSPQTERSTTHWQDINVLAYGAKGDGKTDNHSALTNAINAARASGHAVYFPAVNDRTPTIYVTSALIWRGVSMYGPPCAGVPTTGFGGCVVIEGEPGQDIFASANPTNRKYIAPLRSFLIRDLTLTVDDSKDVSSTLGVHRSLGAPIRTQTCGNAAIAIPVDNGTFATLNPSPLLATFDHVIFNSKSLTPGGKNHSCGVYTNSFPHSTHWNSIIFARLWVGYADAPPPTNSSTLDWASDDNLWIGETFNGDYYPWIEYNSASNELEKWNVYCSAYGPIWLAFRAAARNANWNNRIDTIAVDGDNYCIKSLWIGSGVSDVITNFSTAGQATKPIILNTTEAHIENFYTDVSATPALSLTGSHNYISMHGGSLPNLYTDTGTDNHVCVTGVANTTLTTEVCEFGVGDGNTRAFDLNQMPVRVPTIYVNGTLARPQPSIVNGVVRFGMPPARGAVLQEQP